ncbi:MAG: AI-2E family transporter [Desulfobulbaceae bacterium]|nr:AI-2E family transporter [Desulfobulbaceae bacterium]
MSVQFTILQPNPISRGRPVEKRFEYYARLAATILLVVGCFLVLRPFLSAILFAAVVCVSTWPLYSWLLLRLHGRRSLAALLMTTTLSLLLILPVAMVAYSLAENIPTYFAAFQGLVEAGLPKEPPGWLPGLPLGGYLADYWQHLATSQEELLALGQRLLEPTRKLLLATGILLGKGVMQLILAVFVSFFFYRDGETLLQTLGVVMDRAVGSQATRVIGIVNSTVRGVMVGLLGTALAQGFVAVIGFTIAGVPAVPLLGIATSLLSMVPVGPPLIWGGAAIWLFRQGEPGWGVFMLLWGIGLISTVDNVVKPLLISRGSHLPLLLVVLGVMGGVLAFGFVGIFVGPALLAVALSLIQQWTAAA